MNRLVLIMLAVLLAACSKSEPTDPVESLLADTERLHQIEQRCAGHYAKTSRAECDAARRGIGYSWATGRSIPPKNASKF